MFNLFKKKEEKSAYDVTNLSLLDLDYGFIFDYDMKSWVVKEVYEYDWGGNNFSKEYRIDSGDQVGFLSISEEDELFITFTNPLKLMKIDEDVMDAVRKDKRPPRQLHVEGELFHMEEDSAGYFRDCAKETDDWEEFISWDFFNEAGDKIISITQWDEFNVEASSGLVLKEYQFSNVIPGQ